MKASDLLISTGTKICPECHCAICVDRQYKDFSSREIIVCPHCRAKIIMTTTPNTVFVMRIRQHAHQGKE